ncbi:MAG: serine hydrolase domain-containing protein [bacterium]
MHRIKTLFYLTGLVTILTLPITSQAKPLPTTTPDKAGISVSILTSVDSVINTYIANQEIPGAVILVARNGKIVYKKAYGNRMLKPHVEKMKVNTIFDMASLTKPTATASGIMLLAQEGKLDVHDKVSKYIPGFGQNGKEEVTILNLLTHTSGLKPGAAYYNRHFSYDSVIKNIASMSTSYTPGTKYVYSDLGYITLGEIIRRVSGKPENIFVAERLFKPLGMKDTGYLPPKSKWNRCAPTEFRNGKMLQGQVHDPTAYEMGGVAGHAGLFSTIDDMAIFCQMLCNGGEYNRVRIFTPETVRLMTTNQSPTADRDWGFGWGIFSSDTDRPHAFPQQGIGHVGWTGTAVRADIPTQTYMILLCNRTHPDGKGELLRFYRFINQVSNVIGKSIADNQKMK